MEFIRKFNESLDIEPKMFSMLILEYLLLNIHNHLIINYLNIKIC
jgi:hypothetical protein